MTSSAHQLKRFCLKIISEQRNCLGARQSTGCVDDIVVDSVTRWLVYWFNIWPFAQNHKKFAKVSLKFCLKLNEPFQNGQCLKHTCTKVVKFRQIWSH